VATANLAGLGRAGARVRIVEGDWYAALPAELESGVDVIVSNPPYVADGDPLPDEVARWEPREALLAGPYGLDAIEVVVKGAPAWLQLGGSLVLEIGEAQGDAVVSMATASGFKATVHQDLAGRDRIVVARLRR